MYNGTYSHLSDLAAERHRADTEVEGVVFRREVYPNHTWERILITSRKGEAAIGRPMGRYDTMTVARADTLEHIDIDELSEHLAYELSDILENAAPAARRLLVVGLGNAALTPDSVGARTAELVNPTMHLPLFDVGKFGEGAVMEIAVFCPGVAALSGIDSVSAIKSICSSVKPDALIAIDALATVSEKRLGTTVQISDTGIHPGSGIGVRSGSLTREMLGVPVIAIGVPTVINARVLGRGDGTAGNKNSESLFVTPREIDGICAGSAKLIALGINKAFGIL